MESLLAVVPALGCFLMMPVMLWMMSRGTQKNDTSSPAGQSPDPARNEELTTLREEVARLRSEVDAGTRSPDPTG